MKEIIEFLAKNPTGAFATVDNDKPRVRPWAFMMEDQGKLWFCTSNNKNVYKEMQANPNIEFSSWQGFNILRLNGKVKFSQDTAMKAKILENNPGVKSIYKSPDNPIFEIFYLEAGKATLGEKTYEF